MPLKVAIGVTTYVDILGDAFGAAVYDAHAAVSDRIVPNQVTIWSTKHLVASQSEFSALWLTRTPFKRYEDRRKLKVIDSGEYLIGAEWRRTGAISGRGQVRFRPDTDMIGANELTLEFNYSPKIDWYLLFKRMVAIFAPSYAMLHLFSDADRSRPYSTYDGPCRYDGPIAGEWQFTTWQTGMGNWRKPDWFDKKGRRTYRFLPELSWANHLGREFDGQYDPARLAGEVAELETSSAGVAFKLTDALSDVAMERDAFRGSRDAARAAFAPEFFRAF